MIAFARIRRSLLSSIALALCMTDASAAAPPPSWQQEYWARFENKDWDAAIASAEQLVAAARSTSTGNARQLSEALSLLGSAQLNKGNLVVAEAAFTESLQLAEQFANRGSGTLIAPLRGLGFTLAAENKHAQAIPYMDRALLLSRRTAGLFDMSQQGLLRQLAASLIETGTPAAGERHMVYLRKLGERAYGRGDPRQVPILCIVGDWYAQVGQIETARQHYRVAIDIAERKPGDGLTIIEPLRALAATFPREILLSHYGLMSPGVRANNLDPYAHVEGEPLNPRFVNNEGERALNRALKVLQSLPTPPPQLLAATLLQTGDWFVLRQAPDKAMPYYAQSIALLAQLPGDEVTPMVGFPVQVYFPTPSMATRNLNRPAQDVVNRFVQLEFTVRPDSTVSDVRVTDKDANERQIDQAVDAMQAARYRPKFVDGKPVATTAVNYRLTFKTRKEAE